EIRGAAGEIDTGVRARGAGGRLAALRGGLAGHAAPVHDRDIGPLPRCGLDVAVREQSFADPVRIHMGDLAAAKVDAEPHARGIVRAATQRRARGSRMPVSAAAPAPPAAMANAASTLPWLERTPASAEPAAEPAASAVVIQVRDSAPLPGTRTSSVSKSATVAGPTAGPGGQSTTARWAGGPGIAP